MSRELHQNLKRLKSPIQAFLGQRGVFSRLSGVNRSRRLTRGNRGGYSCFITSISRSVKYILTNRTYTGMLVQGKEKRTVAATHGPLVDTDTFDAIQRSFQVKAFNLTTNSQSTENVLKGKVICGCCSEKM